MEMVPIIEWVRMPLSLTDSDLVDLPFALEANKDSEEDSGHGSKNERCGDKNKGHGNKDKESRSKDRDAI
jgi:hypothetical protein